MRFPLFTLAVMAGITLLSGCRNSSPPNLDSAIPAGTTAVAGIDVAALRASALYAKLPASVTAPTQQVPDASRMMAVWNGKDLLLLASGNFAQPPSGYTLIAPGIAAAGAPDRIQSARDQLRTGRSGVPAFSEAGGAIWGTVQGDGRLPLTGNLANVNNLLREADYTTVSVKLRDSVELELTAHCPSPENARRLEESLRAAVTLATAANARWPEIAMLLHAVRIRREDRTVHAAGSATPEALASLAASVRQ